MGGVCDYQYLVLLVLFLFKTLFQTSCPWILRSCFACEYMQSSKKLNWTFFSCPSPLGRRTSITSVFGVNTQSIKMLYHYKRAVIFSDILNKTLSWWVHLTFLKAGYQEVNCIPVVFRPWMNVFFHKVFVFQLTEIEGPKARNLASLQKISVW